MNQKDYLLREIEKIGAIIRMILSNITHGNEDTSIRIDDQFEETKGMLLHDMGFDVNLFLMLEDEAAANYLNEIKGFNAENIEMLADVFKNMGLNTDLDTSNDYLNKALMLYELCNSKDKTFSFDREQKKSEIKNAL